MLDSVSNLLEAILTETPMITDDLEIDPTTTSLTVNTTSTDVGSPVTLRSRLTNYGSGWNGQTIHFFVDGVEIGSNTTTNYNSGLVDGLL